MKSFFFLSALSFFLLTVLATGQNILPRPTIGDIHKSKGLLTNPDTAIRMHEKNFSRYLPWQVSTNIFKLNGSKYRPVTVIIDDTLRYSYTYDNNGNMLTGLTEKLANNAWVNSRRYSYTYDNNGNRLTDLSEKWTNNIWVYSLRYTYTYDNNGNRLTELSETWMNNSWVNDWRDTYTYDNNRNKLTDLYETWSNNTWENNLKFTYTYDNNGNEVTEISETWANNAWGNDWRDTYTYDNNGNCLTEIYEIWNDNAWVNSLRDSYTYDNNGNMLTGSTEKWTNNTWGNSRRYTYTYDNNGDEISELSETWEDNTWLSNWKAVYIYDNNRNALKGEYFNWTDNAWVTARGSLDLSYNARADYFNIYGAVVNVTYTLIITDIRGNKLDVNTYSLSQNYPNPFNPTTVIKYALPYESNVSINVYNTLGEIVKTFNEGTKQTGSYNVNFNGVGLSSGIYLYSIKAVSIDGKQNFQATKKMILIK
ncbi:MAG: T9SS type A sorting domain-containing protein [Ignavibacteriaceae bacterium]|nr:T9SS type A sorting domain-containing protein [Ignavibacteriaceae bacterium]